MNKIVQEFL